LVRTLASPHPSDVWILPTDVCHPISIFPNCTRAHVARIGFWTRIQSIRGCSSVHADEPAAAGPLAFPQAIHLWIARRPSPLTSLSHPARTCFGLSAERKSIADCQGHFCKPRRDALSAIVTRDAFGRSRFERLPPHGVSLLFRSGPSRISVVSKVTPSRSARRFLFAFASSCSFTFRCSCSRCSHAASLCLRRCGPG
jgi:hypothetical protein